MVFENLGRDIRNAFWLLAAVAFICGFVGGAILVWLKT